MRIIVLGGGNLAYHFCQIIQQTQGLQLVQIYNRGELSHHFSRFEIPVTHNLFDLEQADIYLICIKDEAIFELSKKLNFSNRLVVHTSGNTSIEQLSSHNRQGVVYPVQSFSKDKQVDFANIPLCIEATNQQDQDLLLNFAQRLSSKVYLMSSLQRKYLHISAVFLNNFANHMWYLSQKICQENQIDFEILAPLLSETFHKTQSMSLYQAQTGPARRNDTQTIQKHVSLLDKETKEIYEIITNSILKTYVK